MSTFEYRGYDVSGRACGGVIDGVDAKDARERLVRSGILAEEVSAVASAPAERRASSRMPLDRAVFYHELAALLKAGLPLARALQMLMEAPEASDARIALAVLRDRVAEGTPFHRVLVEVIPSLPAFEVAVLEAAEKTGTLADMLDYLAGFLDEQDRMRGRITNALVYPSIVIATAILIGGVTLGLLVPRIGRVLAESQISQPAITRWVIRIGSAVPWTALVIVLVGGAVTVWARASSYNRSRLRRLWNTLLTHSPLISGAWDILAGLRFARTLALLLRGGVPLVEAVPLAGRATGRQDVAQAALDVAEKVRHGSSLAEAVRSIPALAGCLPGWIQAGEASGQLEELLESAAGRLQNRWERNTARWLALLEPALTLLVSAFVLAIALAVLLPILSMTHAL